MISLPIVLFIFISSNSPQTNVKDGTGPLTGSPPTEKIAYNEKNSRAFQPKVNDLIASVSSDFHSEENHKVKVGEERKIQEKMIPDDHESQGKTPVPLYSLVKNDCGAGYSLDENGVCQKTITVRNGKTFDSEKKRRKRFIPGYELMIERNLNPNFDYLDPSKRINKNFAGDGFGKISIECSKIYPGLVSDGVGGCTKPIKILDSFKKLLWV